MTEIVTKMKRSRDTDRDPESRGGRPNRDLSLNNVNIRLYVHLYAKPTLCKGDDKERDNLIRRIVVLINSIGIQKVLNYQNKLKNSEKTGVPET